VEAFTVEEAEGACETLCQAVKRALGT